MKLPRFLRIDPDFKRAVDVYPNKNEIFIFSLLGGTLFFGLNPYFDATWAERRYARKARDKYRAECRKKDSAYRATVNPQLNKELLRIILSLK